MAERINCEDADGVGRVELRIKLPSVLFAEIQELAQACELTPQQFAEETVEVAAAQRRIGKLFEKGSDAANG